MWLNSVLRQLYGQTLFVRFQEFSSHISDHEHSDSIWYYLCVCNTTGGRNSVLSGHYIVCYLNVSRFLLLGEGGGAGHGCPYVFSFCNGNVVLYCCFSIKSLTMKYCIFFKQKLCRKYIYKNTALLYTYQKIVSIDICLQIQGLMI